MIMKINNKQHKQGNKLDIFSCTQQTIHLYHKFMQSSNIQIKNNQNLQTNLSKFYDGLIWAQKTNPLLVFQMFQMNALNIIVQKYIQHYPIVLLQNSTLLLTNCQTHGLVAQQLLEHGYPHFLLEKIFKSDIFNKNKQQIEQYIGSFLKSYHKLFKIEWLQKFIIESNYFELLQINLRFYNCLQFITRTNSLNIILDLFQYNQIGQFISNSSNRLFFYQIIFNRFTQFFKNQLAEFQLRITHLSQYDYLNLIFDQLQDKILLWEDLTKHSANFYNVIQLSFAKNVLFPLVLGPLKWQSTPLFSLKFALFVLKKLMKTMKNLSVIEVFIRLIFVQEIVQYQPSTLTKALIPPFSLKSLTSMQISNHQEEQKEQLSKINVRQFYQNLLTSKDNHFILITNSLLATLFEEIREYIPLMEQYGFNYGGDLYMKIGNNLIEKLADPHRLHTIQSILNTLRVIGNGKPLETQLCDKYIYYLQKSISQLQKCIKVSKQCTADLIQVLQYDINIIHKVEFGKSEIKDKYQKLFQVVFSCDINKQQSYDNQFYFKNPETPSQHLRYRLIKFMLLRKMTQIILGSIKLDSLLLNYYSFIRTKSPYIVGDIYEIQQFKNIIYQCQIVQHKITYPAVYINNQDFFVLGKIINQHQLEVIVAVKIIHIRIYQKSKELKIVIRQFDSKKQEIVEIRQIKIKGKQQISEIIKSLKQIAFNKHFQFIKENLQKTLLTLPKPSLI